MPAPVTPEDAFKQIDATGKGFITEAELASAIVTISPEGTQLSQADAAKTAQEAFKVMDADQNGKVTQSEFEAAVPKPAASGEPPSGASPGAGRSGPGGAGGAKAASDTTTNLTYAAADANQDGTVSALEQQAYDSKHMAAASYAALGAGS
jgi:hypothetical protein